MLPPQDLQQPASSTHTCLYCLHIALNCMYIAVVVQACVAHEHMNARAAASIGAAQLWQHPIHAADWHESLKRAAYIGKHGLPPMQHVGVRAATHRLIHLQTCDASIHQQLLKPLSLTMRCNYLTSSCVSQAGSRWHTPWMALQPHSALPAACSLMQPIHQPVSVCCHGHGA